MKIIAFFKKHPILFHLLLIILTFFVICYLALVAMDIFTQHGKVQEAPDVKGKTIAEAVEIITSQDLKYEIVDSAYNDKFKPGCVIEQNPKGNSLVKANRTIYLVTTPFSPRSVSFPIIKDMSLRQAESILKGLGFEKINIVTEPSPYDGLVLDVLLNDKKIQPGTKVPVSSRVTLKVGETSQFTESTEGEEISETADNSLI